MDKQENMNETSMDEMQSQKMDKQSGGSCGCSGDKPHPGHLEGPNMMKSDESQNRSQDEGKTYDV